MQTSGEFVRPAFRIRWILLSAFGLAAGILLGLSLADPVEAWVGMMLVTPITLALAGSVFGASQWLAIWRWHRAALWWVLGCAAALALGMTLGIVGVEFLGLALTGERPRLFTADPLERFLSLAAIGFVSGCAVGVAQRLALRALRIPAGRWVLGSVVAFGLGLPIGGLAADVLLGGVQSPAGLVLFLAVSGAVVGAVTARGAGRVAGGLARAGGG